MLNKKAFTLMELMVVLAIVGILSATTMGIFTGQTSKARDGARKADLSALEQALDTFYIKNNFYPQPAYQSENNLWGYTDGSGKTAEPTCEVVMKKDANGKATTDVDYSLTGYTCGGNIYIKKAKIIEISCDFKYREESGSEQTINVKIDNSKTRFSDTTFFLENAYLGDDLSQICNDFYGDRKEKYQDESARGNNSAIDGLDNKIFTAGASIFGKDPRTDSTNLKSMIIGWKGTLTEKSGRNSVNKNANLEATFEGYVKQQSIDPKYTSSKYKSRGIGYYVYAVFRDNVGPDNASRMSTIGGTQFQLAATLENVDDKTGEAKPSTLIVGKYKKPKNRLYPDSLIGGGGRDVIVNEQEYGKSKEGYNVAMPNGRNNQGVPYPVNIE